VTLAKYIKALIAILQAFDPAAYARMCHIVGSRTARIQLDAEVANVRMKNRVLIATTATKESTVDGVGVTDTGTVLALLRGDIEVSEAILNGALSVFGDVDEINRMFQAIEILLDAAPRCPDLQKLSEQFVAKARIVNRVGTTAYPRANWYPFALDSDEIELLARYGLLSLETVKA
jgi:hypothetical protein